MTDLKAPVSVIIPCYRCQDSIERALVSVMRQTLLPAEIVLVDDASPDGGETVRELRRLAARYSETVPIRLIQSDRNGGPGSARNRGWEIATQPFIAFLDADDAWHARKIEVQHAWMRDHPDYKLTCHRHVLATTKDLSAPAVPATLDSIAHTPIRGLTLLYVNAFATRTVMLHADLPFRFKEGKRYAEDYLLWLEMVFAGVRAAKIELPLAMAFKPDFGVGGLSENLWRMELGVQDCYRQLYRKRLIGFIPFFAASMFSVIKFLRRKLLAIWS